MNRIFGSLAGESFLISVQDPLHIDEHSEPQPDVLILKPDPGCYGDRHPEPGDVFLLVEVAEASLAFDRTEKLSEYAKAGVAEYWIVNLPDRVVEIYRQPNYLGYESTETARPGEIVSPAAFPDLEISVAEILGED